jgi:hypothetical protein
VLAFEAVGDINAMIATLDISGIEAMDITNAQADDLVLTVDDLIALSDEADTELQTLLDEALPNTRTIYGDGSDTLVLDGQGSYRVEFVGSETDAEGNTLNIYSAGIEPGNPLATVGVDSDIDVTTTNVVV